MTTSEQIVHLTPRDAWLAAVSKGFYQADSLSVEGFIHCSKPTQIVKVANAFYPGQHGLVLLVIDPARLASELKWEPPADPEPSHASEGELFPHVYGNINLESVIDVLDFEPGQDGSFDLPPGLSL